jgi:hypothetical protein
MRKPFEQHLYDKYDNPAKSKLIELLTSRGHNIKSVAENYYADVVSEKEGLVVHSEAEVKTGWEDEWPETWYEIRIPERKRRLLAKYKGNVSFYIFNNSLSKCWHIKGSQMTDDTIRPATGRNIREGELFFHVDYNDAELINL